MEAAAVVCGRGGALSPRARPAGVGDKARARRHGVGVAGSSPAPARRRALVVTSLGEPLSAHSLSLAEVTCDSRSYRFATPWWESFDSMDSLQILEDVYSTEIVPPPDDVVPTNTVRVKFVLQKKCAFGQHFIVAGDDPELGLWDPAHAAALDWSEDHVWTVTKELPASRLIQFKFLLQDPSGHIRWQHGPNRILHVAETSTTMVVCEDWDDAKKQKVSEEADLLPDAEEVIFSGGYGALLTDELQTVGNQESSNGETSVGLHAAMTSLVAGASFLHSEMPNEAIQPQLLVFDEDQGIPDELRGKANMAAEKNGDVASADHTGGNGEDTILHKDVEPVENRAASIFEIDIAWARKALQQLLRSIALQIGTRKT